MYQGCRYEYSKTYIRRDEERIFYVGAHESQPPPKENQVNPFQEVHMGDQV